MRKVFLHTALMSLTILVAASLIPLPTTYAQALSWTDNITSPYQGLPASEGIKSVSCISSGQCWAVGGYNGPFSQLATSGSSWIQVPNSPNYPTGFNLNSVSCVSSGDCWAAGWQDTILHFAGTGSSFTPVSISNQGSNTTYQGQLDLQSVYCVDSTDCLAVGWELSGNGPTIIQLSGSSWSQITPVTPAKFPSNPLSVSCVTLTNNNSNCWAVGQYGTIIQIGGPPWQPVPPPPLTPALTYLTSVSCISSGQCWAVGGSTLIYYAGSGTWTTAYTLPTTNQVLNSVYCVSSTDCWIVGGNGLIFNWNGSTMTQFNSPTSANLLTVSCISATDCWAGGESGSIIQGTGFTCKIPTCNFPYFLCYFPVFSCFLQEYLWYISAVAAGVTAFIVIRRMKKRKT